MCKDFCRACGQPLPSEVRGGVYLPPRKVMIYDTIQRFPGITAEGIQANCTPFEMSLRTIQVHINQINDMLAGTDLRIGGHGEYHITGAEHEARRRPVGRERLDRARAAPARAKP